MTPGERGGMSPNVVIIGRGNMGRALAAGYHARVAVVHGSAKAISMA